MYSRQYKRALAKIKKFSGNNTLRTRNYPYTACTPDYFLGFIHSIIKGSETIQNVFDRARLLTNTVIYSDNLDKYISFGNFLEMANCPETDKIIKDVLDN